MPTANKVLQNEPFMTRFWLTLLYGPNPDFWSEFAHRATGWEYWKQPDGELVPMWKDRTKLPILSKTEPYPSSYGINANTKERYLIKTEHHTIGAAMGLWQGTYGGEPVQMAKVENGKTVFRSVSYGYSWNQDLYAQVPVTQNPVQHCGGPNVASDRHVCIYDPNSGEMHELIQYDEVVGDTIFNNQALGWVKFKDGKKIAGTNATASGESITGMMWDRDSRLDLHRLGLILGDYVGADGSLESGPKINDIYVLPADSPSYKAMVKLGGECAAIAVAANTYGLKVVDRSGYDDPGSTHTAPGKNMRAPGLWIQWGSWYRTTNINSLNIKLHELRRIV